MAREQKIIIRSDISGNELSEEEAQQVTFSVGSDTYELDLSPEEVDDFTAYMKKYTDVGTKVAGRGVRRSSGGGSATTRADRAQLDAMRNWARENGYEVSNRGRVAQHIQDAYHAAGN